MLYNGFDTGLLEQMWSSLCGAHMFFCDTTEQGCPLDCAALGQVWDTRVAALAPLVGVPSWAVGPLRLPKPQPMSVSPPPLPTRCRPPVLSAFSVPSFRQAAEQKNKSKLPACLGAHDAPTKRSLASHYPPQ